MWRKQFSLSQVRVLRRLSEVSCLAPRRPLCSAVPQPHMLARSPRSHSLCQHPLHLWARTRDDCCRRQATRSRNRSAQSVEYSTKCSTGLRIPYHTFLGRLRRSSLDGSSKSNSCTSRTVTQHTRTRQGAPQRMRSRARTSPQYRHPTSPVCVGTRPSRPCIRRRLRTSRISRQLKRPQRDIVRRALGHIPISHWRWARRRRYNRHAFRH